MASFCISNQEERIHFLTLQLLLLALDCGKANTIPTYAAGTHSHITANGIPHTNLIFHNLFHNSVTFVRICRKQCNLQVLGMSQEVEMNGIDKSSMGNINVHSKHYHVCNFRNFCFYIFHWQWRGRYFNKDIA